MEKPNRTFVKAGKYFINLANITYVQELSATHIEVIFPAAAQEHPMRIQLTGDDASKFLGELESWITAD